MGAKGIRILLSKNVKSNTFVVLKFYVSPKKRKIVYRRNLFELVQIFKIEYLAQRVACEVCKIATE